MLGLSVLNGLYKLNNKTHPKYELCEKYDICLHIPLEILNDPSHNHGECKLNHRECEAHEFLQRYVRK